MSDFEIGDVAEWVDYGDLFTPVTLRRAVVVSSANGVCAWRMVSVRKLTPIEERIARQGIDVVLREQQRARSKGDRHGRRSGI